MLEKVFPFIASPTIDLKPGAEDKIKELPKIAKPKVIAQGRLVDILPQWVRPGRTAFEKPSYDFGKIMKAIDTDSYVKQAFLKYKDLFWKEGWEIRSENPDAVIYLYQRIDLMEESMGRSFDDFLSDISDNLVKYHNCFLAKIRGDISGFFDIPGDNRIIGYELIPIDKIRVKRDKNNKPVKYKQSITGDMAFGDGKDNAPTWDPVDVVHMYMDRKPGHFFGTPFLVGTLEDVISLRMIEEDILNLVHRELSPLYKYKVGTEDRPATDEEIDQAFNVIESMRVDGGLVLSERHDVEVIGAEGSTLDIKNFLDHFKEKTAIGLGVYPHHLGISSTGTNRSATERLDTALYDRVKFYQRSFKNLIRIHIFNEILREGGFKPISSPKLAGTSDRCTMRFNEVDIDTQVKKQTHYINMWNSGAIDLYELREKLNLPENFDPEMLSTVLAAKIQTQSQLAIMAATPEPAAVGLTSKGSAPAPKTASGQKSSSGGAPNLPNPRRNSSNIIQPTNQHGTRNSPNIKRSDTSTTINEDLILDMISLLEDINSDQGESIDE